MGGQPPNAYNCVAYHYDDSDDGVDKDDDEKRGKIMVISMMMMMLFKNQVVQKIVFTGFLSTLMYNIMVLRCFLKTLFI